MGNQNTTTSATLRSRLKAFSGFQASDGKIFGEESLALEHEAALVQRTKLHEFCEQHVCRDMSASDIADLLIEHSIELRDILK